MASAARTEAACLASAITAFPSHPYGYGYMQGAIKSALIQLEYGRTEAAIASLAHALELSERPHAAEIGE